LKSILGPMGTWIDPDSSKPPETPSSAAPVLEKEAPKSKKETESLETTMDQKMASEPTPELANEDDDEQMPFLSKELIEEELDELKHKETGCIYYQDKIGDRLVSFWCIKSPNHFTEI